MSDYLAVGGVSAVLQYLLTNALTSGGPATVLNSPTPVTAVSPDLVATGSNEIPQVNLFMYYVSLNPALRNLDLPSYDGNGAKLSNPPLALNLHYLVTAYGSQQFAAEIILAWAMTVLHDNPVVPSATIQTALGALVTSSPETTLIAKSTLPQQLEHIRITPETLTTEEIYRLWAAFEAPYRPSTAIQVSVVVIQDTDAYTSNLPVQSRSVLALPLQAPVISSLSPSMIPAGQLLTINGSNFIGQSPADTMIVFDNGPNLPPAVVPPNAIGPTFIQVTLPAALQAGTRTLRVTRNVVFPSSTTAHRGFSSSPAPFQLIPTIMGTSPTPATLGNPLKVTINPAVGPAQQAVLYIGDTAIPIDDRPPGSPASADLLFTIPADLPTGTFPIRVEIDGAQSALTLSGGVFLPQVTVS
jgi:Pvc16 N-terminal domain/IPT/TIG domain